MFMEHQALELCSLFQTPAAVFPITWCEEGRGSDTQWCWEEKRGITEEEFSFLLHLFSKTTVLGCFWWRHWWFGGNVMPWWPWLWLKPPFSSGLNHSLTISCTFRHQAAMGVWEDGSFFLVFVFICASFCGGFCLFVCFHLVKAVTLH